MKGMDGQSSKEKLYGQYGSITIEGTTYTAEAARREGNGAESRLERLYGQQFGKDSFHADIARFLAEWFDDGDRVKVHTSGSTGKPKELWVEKERMVNSARLTLDFLGLKRGDTALLCMPLDYIAGKMVVVRALVGGLDLMAVRPCGHPLQEVKVPLSFAAMIPMQVFNTLEVEAEKERLAHTAHLIIGGGAIDSGMAEVLKDFPNRIWSTYGMTETLSHIALRPLSGGRASEWYTPFDTVGLSLSEEHTLVIDAPLVNEETLVTNDIVEFNDKGQFRILGRKDNTINTGGVKVQTEQVEEALKDVLHDDFLITSVPDSKFGEKIVLLTTAKDIAGIPDKLEVLPPYWRPKEILTVEMIPLTETGKPSRARARELAKECLYGSK